MNQFSALHTKALFLEFINVYYKVLSSKLCSVASVLLQNELSPSEKSVFVWINNPLITDTEQNINRQKKKKKFLYTNLSS